ncbi:MAG: hypothetical protein ACLP2F_08485 [Steroidobacteraceae bacterium]
MQLRQWLAATMIGIGAWVLPLGAAQAETVLYDSAGFIEGQQSFVESFDITTPGTLTVTLSNIPWLDTIADLNCFLSTATRVLAPSWGQGMESMRVEPGMIYAHWFGDASGAYDLGVYGIKIAFQPNGMSPVPLPKSLILLLSGLGVLLGWQRRVGVLPASPPDDKALTV